MIDNKDFETGIQLFVIGVIVLLYGLFLSKKSLRNIKKDIEKKKSGALTIILFLEESFIAIIGLFLLVVGGILIIKNWN